MKKYLLLVLCSCFVLKIRAAAYDTLLISLAHAIEQAPAYDAVKIKKIETLRRSLHAGHPSAAAAFVVNEQLYEEYKIFNYDSAYLYASNMQDIARFLNDDLRITSAKLKFAFILLSSGLYRETFDTLRSVSLLQMPDSIRSEYYALMARYYYDLAYYDSDKQHSVNYDITGTRYMDSALLFYPPASFESNYYNGLRLFKQSNTAGAATYFEKQFQDKTLTDHQLALVASTLSGVYLQNGQMDKAIELLARAAIADIRTSTKEVFAIFNLAELLYKKGDVKYASLFIENAIANADFYGARQRKAQVSSILSLIESEHIKAVEAQRRLAVQYGIVVTVCLLALAVLIVVIRKQVKKLQAAKKMITEAHALQQQINEKLEEANKIKEEYIGYFFKLDSEYFVRLEKLKKILEQKLAERKFDEARFVVNNIQLKKEKEELLRNFDIVFLRIFPQFVTVYNSFFREEDQPKLAENELLNTDQRIFALLRIGITDNEKIAEILGYSVKSIYTYKTRVKNRTIIPRDDFEARIMEIKSV